MTYLFFVLYRIRVNAQSTVKRNFETVSCDTYAHVFSVW